MSFADSDKNASPGSVFRTGFRSAPFAAVLLAVLSLLLTASCSFSLSNAGDEYVPPPENENFQDFTDVPYPTEMSVEKGKTVVFTRRDVLSGRVSVTGPLTNDELLDYFDRHLPGHGWTPHSEVRTPDETVSTWAKPGKTLTLMVTKPTLSLGVKSRVDIFVAPPHTKDDLGKRTVYESSKSGSKTYSTTPIRTPGSSGTRTTGIGEEDI
jgi:hypothetical protein